MNPYRIAIIVIVGVIYLIVAIACFILSILSFSGPQGPDWDKESIRRTIVLCIISSPIWVVVIPVMLIMFVIDQFKQKNRD